MLELAGALEAVEIGRQRRRGADRRMVNSSADRDPASVRLLALTWWWLRHPSYTGQWLEMAGIGLIPHIW